MYNRHLPPNFFVYCGTRHNETLPVSFATRQPIEESRGGRSSTGVGFIGQLDAIHPELTLLPAEVCVLDDAIKTATPSDRSFARSTGDDRAGGEITYVAPEKRIFRRHIGLYCSSRMILGDENRMRVRARIALLLSPS